MITHKSFNHFLKNPCNESIFIKPCTNKEITDIISNLYTNKATEPNSTPIKIIKLAKDCTAYNLSVPLNLYFSLGDFPNKLKIAKILSAFKKGSKLECSNYKPISLLSNLDFYLFIYLFLKSLYRMVVSVNIYIYRIYKNYCFPNESCGRGR